MKQWTMLDRLLSLLDASTKINDVYLVSLLESLVLVAKAGCKAEYAYMVNPTKSLGP